MSDETRKNAAEESGREQAPEDEDFLRAQALELERQARKAHRRAEEIQRRLDAAVPRLTIVRKTLMTLTGLASLIAGIVMIFIPGPALLLIPLGIAILAVEFAWVQRRLGRGREWISRSYARYRERRGKIPTHKDPNLHHPDDPGT